MQYVRILAPKAQDYEILGEHWSSLLDPNSEPEKIPSEKGKRTFDYRAEYRRALDLLTDCSVPFYANDFKQTIKLDECLLTEQFTEEELTEEKIVATGPPDITCYKTVKNILKQAHTSFLNEKPTKTIFIEKEEYVDELAEILDYLQINYVENRTTDGLSFIVMPKVGYHKAFCYCESQIKSPS